MIGPQIIILTGSTQHARDTAAGYLSAAGYRPAHAAHCVRMLLSELDPVLAVKNNDTIHLNDVVRSVGWSEAPDLFPEAARLQDRLRRGLASAFYPNLLIETLAIALAPTDRYTFPDLHTLDEVAIITNHFGPTNVRVLHLKDPDHTETREIDTLADLALFCQEMAVQLTGGYLATTLEKLHA